ncbi:MAG: hypothetical protein AAGE84_09510 [Cyanobacteria bacterium P01_G01_bin.39]
MSAQNNRNSSQFSYIKISNEQLVKKVNFKFIKPIFIFLTLCLITFLFCFCISIYIPNDFRNIFDLFLVAFGFALLFSLIPFIIFWLWIFKDTTLPNISITLQESFMRTSAKLLLILRYRTLYKLFVEVDNHNRNTRNFIIKSNTLINSYSPTGSTYNADQKKVIEILEGTKNFILKALEMESIVRNNPGYSDPAEFQNLSFDPDSIELLDNNVRDFYENIIKTSGDIEKRVKKVMLALFYT